jgi:hypothetical protein
MPHLGRCSRLGWITAGLTLCLLLSICALAGTALASARDVAATHAYIRANYALQRASVARIGVAEARIAAYNAKLAAECPRAGRGTPLNESAEPMSYEVAAALWSIAYGTAAGPIHTFARAVAPLRWSSARITRAARSYASDLLALATLPLPDLCADVRAWTASGFHTVPANVTALDRRVEAIEPERVSPSLLAPYAQGGDRGVMTRTTQLEKKLAETEFEVGQNDLIEVTETLGLPE